MKHKKLIIIASLSLIFYISILFFGSAPASYPLPDYSKEDVLQQLEQATEELNIPMIHPDKIVSFLPTANSSIGRYIDNNELNEQQLHELQQQIPLYVIELDSFGASYKVNPETGQITAAHFIGIEQNNIEQFIKENFGEGFHLQSESSSKSFFSGWDVKQTYFAKTTFSDVVNVIDIYTYDNTIVQFDQYGLAKGFPPQSESKTMLTIYVLILIFLITLVIIVTIQLIVRLVRKQIEGLIGPLILSLIAGIGWIFITRVMAGTNSAINMIEPVMMIYLTFATLAIRWKKNKRGLLQKFTSVKQPVWVGFLFAIISLALAELFFLAASHFDTWVSPVLNHNMLIQLNGWMLPLFTLFIGLSAAITEEAIFRNYMIPFFNKGGILLSVIATSFLWGILHIGYDMYPWYLYVIDFMIITGPLFYFVYKKFGFKTVIFLHFFYNAWVTTLFVFAVDINIALLCLIVTLSPFLIFLYREKQIAN